MKELTVDAEREEEFADATGIYVRAIGVDTLWDTYDVAQLDKESFISFIRSRGVVSAWAMGAFFILLGYDFALETDSATCSQCLWTASGPNADTAGYEHYEETAHIWELHTSDNHTRLKVE